MEKVRYCATHCEDCGQPIGGIEENLCIFCEGRREKEQDYNELVNFLYTKFGKRLEGKTMLEVVHELLEPIECKFCGKDLSKKEDQCLPCQEEPIETKKDTSVLDEAKEVPRGNL